jgi:hypothetical protein
LNHGERNKILRVRERAMQAFGDAHTIELRRAHR